MATHPAYSALIRPEVCDAVMMSRSASGAGFAWLIGSCDEVGDNDDCLFEVVSRQEKWHSMRNLVRREAHVRRLKSHKQKD